MALMLEKNLLMRLLISQCENMKILLLFVGPSMAKIIFRMAKCQFSLLTHAPAIEKGT